MRRKPHFRKIFREKSQRCSAILKSSGQKSKYDPAVVTLMVWCNGCIDVTSHVILTKFWWPIWPFPSQYNIGNKTSMKSNPLIKSGRTLPQFSLPMSNQSMFVDVQRHFKLTLVLWFGLQLMVDPSFHRLELEQVDSNKLCKACLSFAYNF